MGEQTSNEEEKNQRFSLLHQLTHQEKAGILILALGVLIIIFVPLYFPTSPNDCTADYRYWTYNGIYHRSWCPEWFGVDFAETGEISNCNISLYTPCSRCKPPTQFVPEPVINYAVNFSGCGGSCCNYGEISIGVYQRNIDACLKIISDGILPNGLTFAHVHAIVDQNEAENISKYQTSKVIFKVNDVTIQASLFTQDVGEYDWNVTLSACSSITYTVDLTLLGMDDPCTFTRFYQAPCV